MPRVQIELPEVFLFSTELVVRLNDINYAGHLGNDTLMTLVQEAREHFFARYGLKEHDIFGLGLVVADAAVVFKSEAFHGETLRFELTPDDFNKYGFDFLFRVSEKSSAREVARGKVGVVFFDYGVRRIHSVPDRFLALLGRASTNRGA
jgi:4-hydroxybenzoyl-CoA thioesterase